MLIDWEIYAFVKIYGCKSNRREKKKEKKTTQSNTGKHNIIVDIRCHCNENIAHVRSLTFSYQHTRTHARTGNPIICYIWLPLIHNIWNKIYGENICTFLLKIVSDFNTIHCTPQIIFGIDIFFSAREKEIFSPLHA